MSAAKAESIIITSALIVFGVYFYRHLVEATTANDHGISQLLGFGSPANIGRFFTAWGVVFLVLSVTATLAPGLAGSFAILVTVADLLGNAQQVSKDINTKLKQSPNEAGAGAHTGVTPQLSPGYQLSHG